MVTPSNIIYSAAPLRRICGLLYRRVTELQIRNWWSIVWIWLPSYRPSFPLKQALGITFSSNSGLKA